MSGSSRSKSSPETAEGGGDAASRAPRFVSNLADMKIDRSGSTGRKFDLSAKAPAK